MNQIIEQLIDAICHRRIVDITYGGQRRTVEPYLLFKNKMDDMVLHGFKLTGEWPVNDSHWSNLRVDKIDSVGVREETYSEPHTGYNPQSKQFVEVLLATAVGPDNS